MTETDSKSWVEVIRYDPSPAGGAGGYRVSIYVESTLIEMPYNLPRERANELASRIGQRLSIEAKLAD